MSPEADLHEQRWGKCMQEVALSLSYANGGSKARGAGSTCGTGALSGQEVGSGDRDLKGQGPLDRDLWTFVLFSCPRAKLCGSWQGMFLEPALFSSLALDFLPRVLRF